MKILHHYRETISLVYIVYVFIPLFTLTLYGHIKTVEQRTIVQQYGDWYAGRWWVGCYIWYSEEGPGRAAAPPSPIIAVPDVTAHPSTASVQWRNRLTGGPWTNCIKGPIPHFEFTEQFIIIKVLTEIAIKHKTMMKCEVDVHKKKSAV